MIRKGTSKDALGIAVTHVQAWQSTYKGILPQAFLDALLIEAREEYWVGVLQGGLGANFVAEVDDKIIGFAHSGPCRDSDKDSTVSAQLYSIYVRAEHQLRKHGQQLFAESRRWAKSKGFREITVHVMEQNVSARSFYEKMKMTADGHKAPSQIGGQTILELRYVLPL